MPLVIPEIVSQHAEEAAFLWLLHDGAVRASNYLLPDLVRLDNRIEAQLDGLRANGDPGWDFCLNAMADGGAGEVFAAAVLAFESGKDEHIQAVLKAGAATPQQARGLVSALGWLPYAHVEGHIQKLFAAESPVLRRVGIAAAAVHRRHPGQPMVEALESSDPALKARALRAAGELGLTGFHATLKRNLAAEDSACRFWANWSAALLVGDKEAIANLLTLSETKGPFQEKALQIPLRRLDVRTGSGWQTQLVETPSCLRSAVIAVGIVGTPELIPWLIEQMKLPPVARVAGEAFSMITGAHIAYDKLEGEKPEGFESGPNENPEDDNVAMDPDGNLYWPNPTAVQKWWQAHQGKYARGVRHLCGKPITMDWLLEVLSTGYQLQRAAAALELAIRQPAQPLFEVRAPGFRQIQAPGKA